MKDKAALRNRVLEKRQSVELKCQRKTNRYPQAIFLWLRSGFGLYFRNEIQLQVQRKTNRYPQAIVLWLRSGFGLYFRDEIQLQVQRKTNRYPQAIVLWLRSGFGLYFRDEIQLQVQRKTNRYPQAIVLWLRSGFGLYFRDEIQLHSHLCEKPVGVTERNRVGLSRIVEDQWRKSLHVEGPDANVSDSLVSTPEPTPKTKPLQETSNKDWALCWHFILALFWGKKNT